MPASPLISTPPVRVRYAPLSMALHWLMAVGIGVALVMGERMTEMKLSPAKLQIFAYHKWLGVTLFGLLLLRLLARRLWAAPRPLPLPGWQQRAAALTHLALYVLMCAVPLSGYVYTYAAGYPVVYLGVLELPAPFPPAPEWKHALKEVHEWLSQAMLVLVLVHVAAALKHHLLDRDATLARMLPGRASE